MLRKLLLSTLLACALLIASGCHHKVQNPLASVDSKQPDKILYDRAMQAINSGQYDTARTLLETLINTYPDSEFLARAKLSIGDAWLAEGGTVGMQQAEAEYKDFQTFFPNLPEAAEAQYKVGEIHFRQMEKPDRDYNHAMRAQEEYRTMIQQYPDSPLIPKAKQRLREVQEILAQRQFAIARFYDVLGNLPAAQARLQSVVDSYPLFSQMDEALYMLGNTYNKEAKNIKAVKTETKDQQAAQERGVASLQQAAINAYSKIITRYPAMRRADDARARLRELGAPVPTPTPEALAESKAEEASRSSQSRIDSLMGTFQGHPDTSMAAKTGEPSLSEEEVVNAAALVRDMNAAIAGTSVTGEHSLGVESVGSGKGTPGENQPTPGSSAQDSTQNNQAAPPPSAPPQVNEVPQDSGSSTGTPQAASGANGTQAQSADSKQDSTSNKKKSKKGLRKIIPF